MYLQLNYPEGKLLTFHVKEIRIFNEEEGIISIRDNHMKLQGAGERIEFNNQIESSNFIYFIENNHIKIFFF